MRKLNLIDLLIVTVYVMMIGFSLFLPFFPAYIAMGHTGTMTIAVCSFFVAIDIIKQLSIIEDIRQKEAFILIQKKFNRIKTDQKDDLCKQLNSLAKIADFDKISVGLYTIGYAIACLCPRNACPKLLILAVAIQIGLNTYKLYYRNKVFSNLAVKVSE